MKYYFFTILVMYSLNILNAQGSGDLLTNTTDLTMDTTYGVEPSELQDILRFEGIDYMRIRFRGKALKGKSYRLTVQEIWDGQVRSDTVIIDSQSFDFESLKTISDSTFQIKILAKKETDSSLKIQFKFPRFSITKTFRATVSNDYSLRNVAEESALDIGYGKPFYLLAYILPYERSDGSKSWCDVGTAGKALENWGAKFGIPHYLLFQMQID